MTRAILFALPLLALPALARADEEKLPAAGPLVVTAFAEAGTTPCEGLPDCAFVLLSGDPARGPTQWFFRIGAGAAFPAHWHSTPENVVPVEGALGFSFETGERHTLRPGEHLAYGAGMVHWGRCEAGVDCLFYVLNPEPYDIHLFQ